MKIAILGLGVVGSGVYKQLTEHKNKIEKETEDEFILTYGLVRTITPKKERKFPNIKLTTNVMDILDDPEVDCLIEVMGSIDFAYEVIKRALSNKKHVITANKDLVALHGVELMKLAKKNKCDFYFEASVAGGVPIVRSVSKGLASDYIYDIKGILNGTSNYILTKMSHDGISYKEALKEAQSLGFAESDPTNDIAGFDTARKLAILAMLSFYIDVTINDVIINGIENVSQDDMRIAQSLGYEIKLIGHSHYQGGEVCLNVNPTFVNKKHQLANVNREMNSVFIVGEAIGELIFFGAGAGSNPTATAVMSDLLEVSRNMKSKCNGRDLIIPFNKKEITIGHELGKYIFIANEKILQDILNLFPATKHTKDYVICELSGAYATKIARENDCKMFPMIESD